MLKAIPKDYHDTTTGTLKLLWEEEWRALGITQVRHCCRIGWVGRKLIILYRVWDGSITRFMSLSRTFSSSSKILWNLYLSFMLTANQASCQLPSTAVIDTSFSHNAQRSLRSSPIIWHCIRWTFYLSIEHHDCGAYINELMPDVSHTFENSLLCTVSGGRRRVIFTSTFNLKDILPSCKKWNYKIFIRFGTRPDLGLGAG